MPLFGCVSKYWIPSGDSPYGPHGGSPTSSGLCVRFSSFAYASSGTKVKRARPAGVRPCFHGARTQRFATAASVRAAKMRLTPASGASPGSSASTSTTGSGVPPPSE